MLCWSILFPYFPPPPHQLHSDESNSIYNDLHQTQSASDRGDANNEAGKVYRRSSDDERNAKGVFNFKLNTAN